VADVTGLPVERNGNGRRPFGGRSISALVAEIARAPEVDVSTVVAGLRPGSVVDGRFEIIREVGRGGFGVVYEARDLALGRTVAFKVVAGGVKDAMREERLLREAAAGARLSHPNIVQLHDMGQSEHGPYLVFELLRGETLERLLEAGPLPTRQVLHVARDVAAALAHAHAAGVFHRDLKPANVVVVEEGHSKVLDFGLARAFGQRSALGGTPVYMAPEQWRGAPEDERTDVFALGVLVFQMLSGELPFPGDTGARDARAPPILEVPDLPALGSLVQRMLARDPVDRPRDAAAVARELDEMGGPAPAEVVVDPVRPRPVRAFRARMAACALASLAAGAALGAWAVARLARAPVLAGAGRTTVVVADTVNRSGRDGLDAVSPLLATALEQSRALDVPGRLRLADLAAQDGFAAGGRIEPAVARELARRLSAQVLLLPEIRNGGPEIAIVVRALDPARMEPLFVAEERLPGGDGPVVVADAVDRLAASIRQSLRSGTSRASGEGGTAVTRNLSAYRHYLLGQQFANESFDIPAAIAEYKAAIAEDPDFPMPHMEMAILSGWHDAPDEDPHSHMEIASRNSGRLPDKERRLVLGYGAFVDQRHAEATRILDALALDYPQDKQVLYVAGEAFWHGDTPGGVAHAANLFRSALDLDPAYLVAYIHLFEWLDRFGPRGEALARAERAARLRPSAEAQAMVARALAAAERWPEAQVAAQNAASLAGGEHFESSYAHAEVLFAAGEREKAERSLRRWLEPSVAPGPRRVAAEVLAPLLAYQGRAREARETLQSATSVNAGQQYDAWDANAMALLSLAGADLRAATRFLAGGSVPPPGRDLQADQRAWLFAWLGDAEQAGLRAQGLAPGSLSERMYAAVKALQAGAHAEAIGILENVARRTSGVEPQFLLGLALARAGRHAEAFQSFDVVTGLHPVYAPVALYVFQPWAEVLAAEELAHLGRASEARARIAAWLDRWSEADPGLPLVEQARRLERGLEAGLARR
jgi:tetratricopeptide (TPR) repeat protein